MQLRVVVVLAASAMVSGCITYPKTLQEFKSTYNVRESFAVPLPLDKTYQLIHHNYKRRYEIHIIPYGSTSVGSSLDMPRSAKVWTEVHSASATGITTLIEMEHKDSTSTLVTAYRPGAKSLIYRWQAGTLTCGG